MGNNWETKLEDKNYAKKSGFGYMMRVVGVLASIVLVFVINRAGIPLSLALLFATSMLFIFLGAAKAFDYFVCMNCRIVDGIEENK